MAEAPASLQSPVSQAQMPPTTSYPTTSYLAHAEQQWREHLPFLQSSVSKILRAHDFLCSVVRARAASADPAHPWGPSAAVSSKPLLRSLGSRDKPSPLASSPPNLLFARDPCWPLNTHGFPLLPSADSHHQPCQGAAGKRRTFTGAQPRLPVSGPPQTPSYQVPDAEDDGAGADMAAEAAAVGVEACPGRAQHLRGSSGLLRAPRSSAPLRGGGGGAGPAPPGGRDPPGRAPSTKHPPPSQLDRAGDDGENLSIGSGLWRQERLGFARRPPNPLPWLLPSRGWRCGGDLTGTKVAATSLLLAVVGALVVGELQQEKGPPSGAQTAAPMQVEAELLT